MEWLEEIYASPVGQCPIGTTSFQVALNTLSKIHLLWYFGSDLLAETRKYAARMIAAAEKERWNTVILTWAENDQREFVKQWLTNMHKLPFREGEKPMEQALKGIVHNVETRREKEKYINIFSLHPLVL